MQRMQEQWLGTMPVTTVIKKLIPPPEEKHFEVSPRKGSKPPVLRLIKHETTMSLAFQRAVK